MEAITQQFLKSASARMAPFLRPTLKKAASIQLGRQALAILREIHIIKDDAKKKMSQTLLTITTVKLKFIHFYLICQKIDTLSFLMSYCRRL